MNGPDGLDEIPPGVPGRVAVCELCGRYWNNFQRTGAMKWCPACVEASLRDICPNPKCGADIPVPPNGLRCFSCGAWLTLWPMVQNQDGTWSPKIVDEPEAKIRKQLESKGYHWHDVVRGGAEGPTLQNVKVNGKPPTGWTKEDFDKYLNQELRKHGQLQAIPQVPDTWYCDHCKVKVVVWGDKQTCPICQRPVVLYTDQDVDKDTPAS